MDGWMGGWVDGWVGGWMDGWVGWLVGGCVGACVHAWVHGCYLRRLVLEQHIHSGLEFVRYRVHGLADLYKEC